MLGMTCHNRNDMQALTLCDDTQESRPPHALLPARPLPSPALLRTEASPHLPARGPHVTVAPAGSPLAAQSDAGRPARPRLRLDGGKVLLDAAHKTQCSIFQ